MYFYGWQQKYYTTTLLFLYNTHFMFSVNTLCFTMVLHATSHFFYLLSLIMVHLWTTAWPFDLIFWTFVITLQCKYKAGLVTGSRWRGCLAQMWTYVALVRMRAAPVSITSQLYQSFLVSRCSRCKYKVVGPSHARFWWLRHSGVLQDEQPCPWWKQISR